MPLPSDRYALETYHQRDIRQTDHRQAGEAVSRHIYFDLHRTIPIPN